MEKIVREAIISHLQENSLIKCTNSKALFSVANEMIGSSSTSLPSTVASSSLPDTFVQFFINKISTIRDGLDVDSCTPESSNDSFDCFDGCFLKEFKPVTPEEIEKIIMSSPPKSCPLDPIPTTLLVQCLDSLLDIITSIVNQSLQTGIVPTCFKEAIVAPLLKKHNLDPEDLKNYRPVSNSSFISKILEKVVLAQLKDHLKANNLINKFQSAYREHHSTESALLRIVNDILQSGDEGNITILTLLDLSAAFDTIDHSILLEKLSLTSGISGIALSWFESYLTERSQSVFIRGNYSNKVILKYGVPQGSVLGPVLFTLYMLPLSKVFVSHDMKYHMYADDSQLYAASRLVDFDSLVSQVQDCFDSVKTWMRTNKLQLNNDKTEVMLCATESKLNKIEVSEIQLAETDIHFSDKAKNLGVFLDKNLSMEYQINYITKSMFFEIRRISRMKSVLTQKAVKTLVISLVLSRLDYCNSLYAGLSDDKIFKLQKAQNCAARLILGKSKFESSTQMLKTLHWLPVKARIEYKIAVFCYSSIKTTAPTYISELLSPYVPPRALRSQDSGLLVEPRCNLKTFGDRSFRKIGPTLWNSLPNALRSASSVESFRKHLKTHLFKKYFDE